MRVPVSVVWAGAALLWLAACEEERAAQPPAERGAAQEADTRQADEAGGAGNHSKAARA